MVDSERGGLKLTRLSDDLPFGAIVHDLTLECLDRARTRQALYDLWIAEGVVVFEGVAGEEMQLKLSSCFGKLIAHPTREARADHPALMTVRYQPDDGWLLTVNGESRGSWLPWHSDLIYVDRINRGGVLRPVKLPSSLGETGFIDKILAYETLPDRLKSRIEGLDVIYQYDLDPAHQRFGRTADVTVERYTEGIRSIQSRLGEFPRVIHPMVYVQQGTDRKVLNVSPWFAVGIHGMENTGGDALLEEVAQHIVRSPHVYLHHWKMEQMVLWDNWRVLHCSTGCPQNEERWMLRTTIEGDYGLGRTERNANADGLDYISV
ncbi:TauD/TfdA dioxygenase family protein [Sphingopyxis sp. 22461]|uniref:TauD/TfdA dioxygenase family protein n=1 Tax=Sphingopyxis sp. 22461 TaxID=3453923 RepID=UPI003F86C239